MPWSRAGLEELGLEYESVPVPMGELRDEEYLARVHQSIRRLLAPDGA